MSEVVDDIRVAWMRKKGVVQAQWNTDGTLVMCVLGPEPFDGPIPTISPNPEPTDEEILFMSS